MHIARPRFSFSFFLWLSRLFSCHLQFCFQCKKLHTYFAYDKRHNPGDFPPRRLGLGNLFFFSFTHKTHERTDTQTKTISFLAPPNVPANDWPSTHTQHPFQAFLGLLLFLTICLSRSCATTVWPPNGSWTAPRCPRPSSGLPRTPRWLHGRTNPASCQWQVRIATPTGSPRT